MRHFRIFAALATLHLAMFLISEQSLAQSRASVTIHLLAASPERISRDLRKQTDETVLREINRLKSKYERRYISYDERHHSVIFVFHQPLRVGTRIRTEHQFARPRSGKLKPYRFNYRVKKSSPTEPYILLNLAHAGGRGGTITYRAFVNRRLAATKTVSIGR